MKELRCGSKILHGVLDEDIVEVSCRSKWCGKRPGVVVIHRFNKNTGELLNTQRFQEPKEVNINGTAHEGSSVRTA